MMLQPFRWQVELKQAILLLTNSLSGGHYMAFTSSQKELISSMGFQNQKFKEVILRGDMIRSSVICSGKVCDFHITSDSDS